MVSTGVTPSILKGYITELLSMHNLSLAEFLSWCDKLCGLFYPWEEVVASLRPCLNFWIYNTKIFYNCLVDKICLYMRVPYDASNLDLL